MRRVVVTGLGIINALGDEVDTNFTNLVQGICGIESISIFDTTNFKTKVASMVKKMPERHFTPRDLKVSDRFSQFARICAKDALLDSKIDLSRVDKNRIGVILASGIGGISAFADNVEKGITQGYNRISPYFIPQTLTNLAAGTIAIDNDIHGYTSCITTACAASANAIGESYLKIKDGYQDIMVCGGAEATITEVGIAGFENMKALSVTVDPYKASIPFDKKRNGFVMGEGAAVLVLEELEHALARKAPIYGEIVGYGSTTDAYHITKPDESATYVQKAMEAALAMANITGESVDYINAHGTSTHYNDLTEATAISKVAPQAYVSSTKASTGHLLGAAGATEAIYSLLALKEQVMPGTINVDENEFTNLKILTKSQENKNIKYAMSNSLGFGGHNVSLLFKRYADE